MQILVTGGAGYIGSILVESLIGENHKVVVLDNLRSGHKNAVPPSIPFYVEDFSQPEVLDQIFSNHSISVVIHTAASVSPTGSISNPKDYLQNNIVGGLNLINTMLKFKVKNIIFSSSACVYGQPHNNPVNEDSQMVPTTPYGLTKLMFEQILEWYSRAYGLGYIVFRPFNVSGATKSLGADKPYNNGIIPNILKVALGKTKFISIFGSDYPTFDGSCVRDYVHVRDIIKAHVLALNKLGNLKGIYNLGGGVGYSVFEVVEEARKVTNKKIPIEISPRRAGDPAILVADIARAERELRWKPEHSKLNTIIRDTWNWMGEYPDGYNK